MAFSSPLAPQAPTTFTYLGQTAAGGPIIGGVLIGDFVDDSGTTPSGSAYNEPSVTEVNGVPVNAQLELQSTTGAFLVMRMTTTQRNAMTTVVDGMMIFNTTTDTFQFYQGSSWLSLSAGAGGVTGPGSSTDNAIVRWDGAGGTTVQDSTVIVSDAGAVTGVTTITNTSSVQFLYGKSGTTAAYAGGGTSNAYTATGLTAAYKVVATILASTNNVAIAKAVPGTNTLTVTFTADPGADTTVSWIATPIAIT